MVRPTRRDVTDQETASIIEIPFVLLERKYPQSTDGMSVI